MNYDLSPEIGWKDFPQNRDVCKYIFNELMPNVNSENLHYLNFTTGSSAFEDMSGNMLQMRFNLNDEDLIINMNLLIESESAFKDGYLEKVIVEIENTFKIMRI